MNEIEGDPRIAIIGMAGRFPGARNIDELWLLLQQGRDARRPLTEEELRAAGAGESLLRNSNFVRSCMPVADIDRFDAGFFGFTPRQAADIDPQHRLFLECCWEAFEDAGYDVASHQGSVGVFAGAGFASYLFAHCREAASADIGRHVINADKDLMCPRVSYKLGLTGPSMAIQSGCSTSLVAVHMGVQSLLSYESDMVLAGGSSLKIPQLFGYSYAEGDILSPDGRCRAYDANAKGTVPGSGVAVLLLKRYADAVADGDHVHAIIRGSAVNNDGAQKAGFAAPSPQAQAHVITTALQQSGLSARDIGYVEGHGTGTVLGDAIELAALTAVFDDAKCPPGSCAIGSIKTNVGHLDAAAGVTGLIKAVLCLKNRTLVPTLHFTAPNAAIAAQSCAIYVNTELRPWHAPPDRPRYAGVSSFGVGGTNAHVILEEAPEPQPSARRTQEELFVFSAATPCARAAMLDGFARRIERQQVSTLHDIAFTTQVGRKRLAHHAFVIARDAAELLAGLRDPTASNRHAGESARGGRSLCWIFPEALPRRIPDVSGLYASDDGFRRDVDDCRELLRKCCGVDALRFVAASRATDAALTQREAEANIFALQWAIARRLLQWGLRPSVLIGAGIGEYVCACIAGVFSLEDAVRVLAARSVAAQGLPPHAPLPPLHSDLIALTRGIQCGFPNVKVLSACSGALTDAALADFDHWVLAPHTQHPISPQVIEAVNDRRNLCLEIGSGDSLIAAQVAGRNQNGDRQLIAIESCASPPVWDRRTLLTAIGQAWLHGASLEERGAGRELRGRRVSLPTYPFQRQRYWLAEPPQSPVSTPPADDSRTPAAIRTFESSDTITLASDLEGVLCNIWSEILGIEQIQRSDTFFDLGGDSLAALRVTARIEELAGLRLPLRLFVDPQLTLAKLTDAVIAQMSKVEQSEAERPVVHAHEQ